MVKNVINMSFKDVDDLGASLEVDSFERARTGIRRIPKNYINSLTKPKSANRVSNTELNINKIGIQSNIQTPNVEDTPEDAYL